MANTKNYTEHGGSVTHIGGELVLDPGSKIIKDGQEIDIGGGGSPVFDVVAIFSYEDEEEETIICDKTYQEITAALNEGKTVCGFFAESNVRKYFLTFYDWDDAARWLMFDFNRFRVDYEDGAIEMTSRTYFLKEDDTVVEKIGVHYIPIQE